MGTAHVTASLQSSTHGCHPVPRRRESHVVNGGGYQRLVISPRDIVQTSHIELQNNGDNDG